MTSPAEANGLDATEPKRCAIYARTATGGAEAIRAQLATLRSAVEARGDVVVRTYWDVNVAVSGCPGYGLQSLIADLNTVEFDDVVITELTRFGDDLVGQGVLAAIEHRGARVLSLDQLRQEAVADTAPEPITPPKRTTMKMKKKTRKKLLKRMMAIRHELDDGWCAKAEDLVDDLIDDLSPPSEAKEAEPLFADVEVTFKVITGDPALRYRPDVGRHAVGGDALVLHPAGHAVSVKVHNMGPAHVSADWTSDVAASGPQHPVIIAPGQNSVFQLHPGDLRHSPVRLQTVAP